MSFISDYNMFCLNARRFKKAGEVFNECLNDVEISPRFLRSERCPAFGVSFQMRILCNIFGDILLIGYYYSKSFTILLFNKKSFHSP